MFCIPDISEAFETFESSGWVLRFFFGGDEAAPKKTGSWTGSSTGSSTGSWTGSSTVQPLMVQTIRWEIDTKFRFLSRFFVSLLKQAQPSLFPRVLVASFQKFLSVVP